MGETDATEHIAHAVCRRRLLRLNYHFYSRVVEPYAIGMAPDGRAVLVAWQVSGGSDCGPATGWKAFILEEIFGMAELLDEFVPTRAPDASLLRPARTAGAAASPAAAASPLRPPDPA